MDLTEKYRPQTLDGIYGNRSTCKELKNYLVKPDHRHTILLTGPLGSGKTTVAQILGRELLGLKPEDSMADAFDFHVINAASSRGIDDIRHLLQRVHLQPIACKKRVAFFDECHGLTLQAQEALLKMTEHPPEHLYFIFATTEPLKLIPTLRDRCVPFEMTRLEQPELLKLLKDIAELENKEVELNKIEAICSSEKISVRSAIIQLDKILPVLAGMEVEQKQKKEFVTSELDSLSERIQSSNQVNGDHYNKNICHNDNFLKAIESIVYTSRDLLNREFHPVKTFLSPFLKEGSLTMIYAKAGVGKSMFVASIAIALTRDKCEGIEIGKLRVSEPCGVLILDGEMRPYEIKNRFSMLSAPTGEESKEYSLNIITSDEMMSNFNTRLNFSTRQCREGVTRYLENNPSIKVLVLDNKACLMPSISENSKEGWEEINFWLLSLRNMGVAVIILHHQNKSTSFRGHSSVADNLDTIIKLNSIGGADELAFEIVYEKARGAKKGEFEPFSIKAINSTEGNGLEWELSNTERAEKIDEDISEIIMAKAMLKEKSQRDIAHEFGVSQPTVSNARYKAKDMGYLDENDQITQLGAGFVDSVISAETAEV